MFSEDDAVKNRCIVYSFLNSLEPRMGDLVMPINRKYIISFYTWWKPEKDSDEALYRSLSKIQDIGFQHVSFDIQHTWYMRKKEYWNRFVNPCKKIGLNILPVVTYGYLPDATILEHITDVKITKSILSDGSIIDCVNPCDLNNVEGLVLYIERLVSEYGDVFTEIDGSPGVIIWEPSMVIWGRGERRHIGYDTLTILEFRKWCAERYNNISHLNKAWGSDFRDFDEVEPPRKSIWEGARRIIFMDYNKAWDDWCLFRAERLTEFYRVLSENLRSSGISVLIGLSQHGVVVQHDAFYHRCVYLPFWVKVPANRFIASVDLYCKSPSEIKLCFKAELAVFKKYFGARVAAYVTPVESFNLVACPEELVRICDIYGVKEINFYAWNEMGDGANIRDHNEIWDNIKNIVLRRVKS